MANTESPGSGSALSEIDSDQFTEDLKFNRSRSQSNASTVSEADSDESATLSTSTPRQSEMRPTKRRRIGTSTYDHHTPQSAALVPPRSPTGSISSDSSGSVPTSPSFAHLGPTHPLSTAYAAAQANPDNPEMADYVQVTRCQWTDCPDPEQGNMDNLVQHINDIHILPRQKKYFCEWEGCTRKSMPHTSAYALKAHMRSHTKEKPFMCALPECDRSFTRSDALAKHMRTVHETEALRPSDPVPRGHTGGISNGGQVTNGTIRRIKLVMGGSNGDKKVTAFTELPPLPNRATVTMSSDPRELEASARSARLTASESADPDLQDAVDVDSVPLNLPLPESYYPSDIYSAMEPYELALPPSQYYRLLRRQIHWAQQESTLLNKELADARVTTDDTQGNVTKRSMTRQVDSASKDDNRVPLDERVGDEIRRDEWAFWEGLADNILKAELVNELTKSASINGELEGKVDAVLNEQNIWDALQAMHVDE